MVESLRRGSLRARSGAHRHAGRRGARARQGPARQGGAQFVCLRRRRGRDRGQDLRAGRARDRGDDVSRRRAAAQGSAPAASRSGSARGRGSAFAPMRLPLRSAMVYLLSNGSTSAEVAGGPYMRRPPIESAPLARKPSPGPRAEPDLELPALSPCCSCARRETSSPRSRALPARRSWPRSRPRRRRRQTNWAPPCRPDLVERERRAARHGDEHPERARNDPAPQALDHALSSGADACVASRLRANLPAFTRSINYCY